MVSFVAIYLPQYIYLHKFNGAEVCRLYYQMRVQQMHMAIVSKKKKRTNTLLFKLMLSYFQKKQVNTNANFNRYMLCSVPCL